MFGHGSESNYVTPTLVTALQAQALQGDKIKQVACGSAHTVVLTRLGKVYAFGCNKLGQIGQGKDAEEYYSKPTLVEGFDHYHIIKIACSRQATHAVTQGVILHW